LRDQVQTLLEQQRTLAVELDSHRNKDPQIARTKNDSFGTEQNQAEKAELLRLRGELGRLRQESENLKPAKSEAGSLGGKSLKTPANKAEFQMAHRQVSTAMFRVGSALNQFVANNPYGTLVDTNGLPNPEIFANFPGLPLDNLEIQVKDVQSLAKALDEKSRSILAVTKSPIYYDLFYLRFYLLADGSVRTDFSYNPSYQKFRMVYPSDEVLDSIREHAQAHAGGITSEEVPARLTLNSVAKAFMAANGGQGPADLGQLTPYATTSEQQALQTLLRFSQEEDHSLVKHQ